MPYVTRTVGELGKAAAQFIRNQLDAGRYVYIDYGRGVTHRVVTARRHRDRVSVRAIDGAWVAPLPTDVVRVERA